MMWLGWSLIQYNWYTHKKGKFGHKPDIHRGMEKWRHQEKVDLWQGRASTSQGTARIADTHQKLQEARNTSPAGAFRGNVVLTTPWFQTSSFQIVRINLCFLSLPVWSILLRKLIHLQLTLHTLSCLTISSYRIWYLFYGLATDYICKLVPFQWHTGRHSYLSDTFLQKNSMKAISLILIL